MPKPDIQILVCLNERPLGAPKPSCGPRGALDVYQCFKDRVRERGLRETVMVTRTGCLKHCSQGVTVVAWPLNLWFGQVTVDEVETILEWIVTGGPPNDRMRMPDIPWE